MVGIVNVDTNLLFPKKYRKQLLENLFFLKFFFFCTVRIYFLKTASSHTANLTCIETFELSRLVLC